MMSGYRRKLLLKEYRESKGSLMLGDEGTAEILGIAVSELRRMRDAGEGPMPERRYHSVAHYRKSEIERYRNETKSTL